MDTNKELALHIIGLTDGEWNIAGIEALLQWTADKVKNGELDKDGIALAAHRATIQMQREGRRDKVVKIMTGGKRREMEAAARKTQARLDVARLTKYS